MNLENLYKEYEKVFKILNGYYNWDRKLENILGKRECDIDIVFGGGEENKINITEVLVFLDLFFDFSPDTADLNEIFILLKTRFFERYADKNVLREVIKGICNLNEGYLTTEGSGESCSITCYQNCDKITSKICDETSFKHLPVVKRKIFEMLMANYLMCDAIKFCRKYKYYKDGLLNIAFIPKLFAGVLIGYMYMFSIGQNLRYILEMPYLWIFNIIVSLLLLVFVEAKDTFITIDLKFVSSILLIILGIFYSFVYSFFFNIVFSKFLGVHYDIFSVQNFNAVTIAIIGGYITQAFWSKDLITKI